MALLFISHSSRNNDKAVEVRDWLAKNGWDDVFLDLDPERGIVAGQRWKDALQKAAQRCEMVLALISAEWLASPWCKAEIDAARLMGKKVLVALIGIDKAQVPPDLNDEQWIDLTGDPNAYTRLREGLRRGGLDPSSFPFEAGRRPYPGFASLEEKDAAIFFGRDAQIVRGLDKIRSLVRAGVDRMLVILGASGSGKSSFFCAGLWPRLKRDDRTWLPLPTIRPERAVISGKYGLVQSLQQVMGDTQFADGIRQRGLPRSRADIQDFIDKTEDGLVRIFAALRDIAQVPGLSTETTPPPTIVLSVDQGEELFNEDGRDEAGRFIEMLTRMLKADPHTLAILVMRSDSFPQLQTEARLADLPKDTFTLDMMLEGSYRDVIEGPAGLVQPNPLKIDPQLTDALLEDVSGQDALPLLAFTLAHLYENYAADNQLNLADYEKLGRLKGVIATTVREAFAEGAAKGELPKDAKAQLALARMAFIPHLARVNPAGQFVRRIATRAEIPAEARPLIDRFAERRLLIRDRRKIAGEDVEVIEVAHEALLREWDELHQALQEQREFLVAKGQLEEDVAEWQVASESHKSGALLSGNKLLRARDWLVTRPQELSAEERQFIKASVNRDAKGRRQIKVTVALVILAILGFGIFAGIQWMAAERAKRTALRESAVAQAGRLAAQADLLRERGSVDDSVLLAAEGLRLLKVNEARSMEVDLSLRRALALLPRRLGGFEGGSDQEMEIASDGRHVTVRSRVSDRVSVRLLPSGEMRGCRWDDIVKELATQGVPSTSVGIYATSTSGSHCATVTGEAAERRIIDIWSAAPLSRIASVPHTGAIHVQIALSDGAEFIAITDRAQSGEADSDSLRVWDIVKKRDVLRRTGAKFVAFSPDRTMFATTKGVWRLPTAAQEEAMLVLPWPRTPWFIAFNRSGNLVGTRSSYEDEVQIWDLSKASVQSVNAPQGKLLALDRDGRLIVIQDATGTLLWDVEQGVELARLPVEPLAAAFGEREVIVLTSDEVLALQPPSNAVAAVYGSPREHVLWAGLDERYVYRLVDTVGTMRIDSWPWATNIDSWAWRSAEVSAKFRVESSDSTSWTISADGRRFAIGQPDGIATGAIDNSGAPNHVPMPEMPSMLALSAHGDMLAAATGSTAHAWRLGSGEHWTLPAQSDISALRVSADGQYVLTVVRAAGEFGRGGLPYQLLRWRLAGDPKADVVSLGQHMSPPALRCLVTEDGSSVFAGGQWRDIATGATAPLSRGDKACAAITGATLHATIEGRDLVITDTDLGHPIVRLEHSTGIEVAALSPDGRHALTLDGEGNVRVWALDRGDLIAQVCGRGPRALGVEAWDLYMPADAKTDACGHARDNTRAR